MALGLDGSGADWADGPAECRIGLPEQVRSLEGNMVYSDAVESWLKSAAKDPNLSRARGCVIASTGAYSWSGVTEEDLEELVQQFQSCLGRISSLEVKGKTTTRQTSETLTGKFTKQTGRPILSALSEHGTAVMLLRKTGYLPPLLGVMEAVSTIRESLAKLDK